MLYFEGLRKGSLTHKGIFFKREGDLLTAIQLLNQNRQGAEVIDSKFSYLYEEVQKRRALYTPYRSDLNPHSITCRSLKQLRVPETLIGRKKIQDWLTKDWESMLIFNVRVSVHKMIRRFQPEILMNQFKMPSHYFFLERGLFFPSEESLVQAVTLFSEHKMVHCVLSSDVAYLAQEIRTYCEDIKKVHEDLNILTLAETLSQTREWRFLLQRYLKNIVMTDIYKLYRANAEFFKKEWSLQPHLTDEFFWEENLDQYAPFLRPDLFSETSHTRIIQK